MKNIKKTKLYSKLGKAYDLFLSRFFPVFASKRKYKKIFGRRLDLKNPISLNEKLMYLKLYKYWNNKNTAFFADKYRVREFIAKSGCSDILTKLYGVYDKGEDIPWDSLPKRFVLKCNHGSGFNIVCKDKSTINRKETIKTLNGWMRKEYGLEYIEQGVYSKIKRKIIAEEFIETNDGLPPKDFKFFCSYGKVLFLFVASDRYDDNTKFDYFEPNWTHINVRNYFKNAGSIEKPKNLEQMIKYAERLSKDFPCVRIDLYSENERIYFGEITLTHFGCLNRFDPDEYDYIFGKRFPDVEDLRSFHIDAK